MKCCLAAVAMMLALTGATSKPSRNEPPTYACGRADGTIAIDGAMDDAAWKLASWTEEFIDIVGSQKNEPPSLRTRAKLLYDDANLYIAAELTDPNVAATIRQRDEQLFREQAFEVFIDPGGDGKDYLELQINPLNTVCDLSMDKPYRDKGTANVAFNLAGLRSAVRVKGTVNDPANVDEGWTVELAIPWSALKALSADAPAPPRGGERWRVNLARMRAFEPVQRAKGTFRRDMSVWAAQGAVNMHLPERWGWVEFARDSAKPQN